MSGTIRYDRDAGGVVTLTLDDPGQSANTMNRAYAASMKDRDAEGKSVLRTAQRAWLKSRDADVALAVAAHGGRLGREVAITDVTCRLTRVRTKQLTPPQD